LLLLIGIFPLSAQRPVLHDTVRYAVTLGGLYSSGQFAPFWLQSLNYGKVYHTPTTAYGSLAVYKDYGYRERLVDWGFGADFLSRTDLEVNGIYAPIKKEFYFQELYAKARFMSFQIIAGANEEIIGVQDSSLSAGGFIFSKNARPIPKITAGFTDYVAIPSTNEKLLIKGRISHGWFLDDYYLKVTDVLLHHKNLYLKIKGSDYPWWIEGGLEHFAMWAGKVPGKSYGNVSLVNFIKVFFGKQGGSDATNADKINAFGNHMLSQSVKAGAILGDYTVNAYWQNYNEDGPMRFFWGAMNKEDGLFGLSIKNRKGKLIQGFLYEFFSSTDQSGPYHDKDGMIYGGSDNYFSNDYGSWSYYGRTVGIPFISSTLYTVVGNEKKIRGNNNLVKAHHFGMEGNLKGFEYRLLGTYSENYGTPKAPFPFRRRNASVLCELNRNWGNDFTTSLSLGADYGSMYGRNYGAMLTLKKSGNLFRMRAPRVVINPLW